MKRKKRKIAESRADSAKSQNLNKNNSVRSTQNSPASWCKKSESKGAEVPPVDFLLEAEKRGSPPKSEKRQLLGNSFKNSWGEWEGGAALLREKTSEISGEGIAESIRDSSLRLRSAQNDNLGKIVESSEESRNHKKGKRGFKRLYNAFFYSLSGLKTAFCEEEAFRQIVLISAILIPLGAYLGENFAEKVLLILPCVMAILAELANSAIENAIDFAGLKIHPFAKNAKDMGSAMQLIACAFMGGVWIFYLTQRFVI